MKIYGHQIPDHTVARAEAFMIGSTSFRKSDLERLLVMEGVPKMANPILGGVSVHQEWVADRAADRIIRNNRARLSLDKATRSWCWKR